MMKIIISWVDKIIDWVIRPKNVGLAIFSRSIAALTILGGGGIALTLIFKGLSINIQGIDSIPFWISNGIFILLIISASIGLVMAICIYRKDSLEKLKATTIIIEGRGLAAQDGFPLSAQIGKDISGKIIPVFLNLRQGDDSKITDPALLISKILSLKELVLQSVQGVGREHTNLIYGGITAVPFTFLTGLEIDDETSITIYDWDRFTEKWRLLNEADDGSRFVLHGESLLEEHPAEVVLAISISYIVKKEDIESAFDIPVIELILDGHTSESHWSGDKQIELSKQFLHTSKLLCQKGVKKIHLVMAAPNSIVFRFGRNYDKRNLPAISVYQFEYANQECKYPWSVAMNVSDTTEAVVDFTE